MRECARSAPVFLSGEEAETRSAIYRRTGGLPFSGESCVLVIPLRGTSVTIDDSAFYHIDGISGSGQSIGDMESDGFGIETMGASSVRGGTAIRSLYVPESKRSSPGS